MGGQRKIMARGGQIRVKPNNTVTLDLFNKLATARLIATTTFPYFGPAIACMVPKEKEGLGTLAVTKDAVLYYDPKVVMEWPLEVLAGAYLHESLHLVRDHPAREVSYGVPLEKHVLWNLAADCEINDDILEAGLVLPEGVFTPQSFKLKNGQTAEWYYHKIRERIKVAQLPLKPCVGGGWCGSGGGKAVPGEEAGGKDGAGKEKQAGGATGDSQEEGQGTLDGRTEVDLDRMRRQVAQQIQTHGKQAGNVPGSWARWANDFCKPPKVRWQDKFKRCVRGAIGSAMGAVDYTMTRIPRRQASLDMFFPNAPRMPSMHRHMPRVAFWTDTSGSMSQADLTTCLREARGVLLALGSQVDFLTVDAEIQCVQTVKDWRTLPSLLKGGGGTDFRAPFRALAKMKRKPDIIVYATDGMGPCPSKPPRGIQVIWLLVGPSRQKPYMGDHDGATPCNWGEFIEVDDDGAYEEAA